ncbi:phosphoribosylglycinamide formyltransferase [Corynebacterium aquilae]|uniref:phosphoribosylglycinamide formyltransferase n=1 Tax=Corynebacterium aquilae TaxID=203263 RepID=UPI0009FCAE10|nr:phosphoribosylglycinamide formyltransferase [Corynebacterium aquilae]
MTPTTTGKKPRLRIVVLASGAGTLAEAIFRAAGDNYQVVALVTDTTCPALDKATAAAITSTVVPLSDYPDRDTWNTALTRTVSQYQPDIVVSAGFMRILNASFLQTFDSRVINTHPALLPAFPGAHAVRDALHYGVKITGTTVHVVDTGVDTGPIIAQQAVPVAPDDTESSLHERIKKIERELIVTVLNDNPLAAIAAALNTRGDGAPHHNQ